MNASAIRKILTFRRNAREMSGSESRYASQLKNAVRTSGHPGEWVTT
jgi:hypothetical protein